VKNGRMTSSAVWGLEADCFRPRGQLHWRLCHRKLCARY